jgi:REP element-mobilizing transposase RayT
MERSGIRGGPVAERAHLRLPPPDFIRGYASDAPPGLNTKCEASEIAIMPHSYTQLYYHIVFSTKNREPMMERGLRQALFPFIGGGIREEGGHALVVNGVEDRVHMLVRLRTDRALSDVVRNVKAYSSGWVHKQFPDAGMFAWQTGYAAFTVSASQRDRVRRYIDNQEEHHRRQTYQEELIELLRAHEVEFDERYLWE